MNPVDISIYGIIDPARTKGRDLGVLASEAVAGGVTLLQYRHKRDIHTIIDQQGNSGS